MVSQECILWIILKKKKSTVHTKLLSLSITSTDLKTYASLWKNLLAPLLTCTCILWGFFCLFILWWGVVPSPSSCVCPSRSIPWARQGGLTRISTGRVDSRLVCESLLFKRGGVFLHGHYPLVWMLMWLLDVISQVFLTGKGKIPAARLAANHCFQFSRKKKEQVASELSEQVLSALTCFALLKAVACKNARSH